MRRLMLISCTRVRLTLILPCAMVRARGCGVVITLNRFIGMVSVLSLRRALLVILFAWRVIFSCRRCLMRLKCLLMNLVTCLTLRLMMRNIVDLWRLRVILRSPCCRLRKIGSLNLKRRNSMLRTIAWVRRPLNILLTNRVGVNLLTRALLSWSRLLCCPLIRILI